MPGTPISIGYKQGMPTSSQAALLLIDMQKESRYGIEGVDEAVAAAEGVIAACRTAGVPVVYTRHVNRRDGVGVSIGEVFDAEDLPVYYPAETDAIRIFGAIEPQPRDVVIDKHRWSGFHGTSLDLILRSLGARELFIGGFTTDCSSLPASMTRTPAITGQPGSGHVRRHQQGSHHAAILMMANWVYGIEILTAGELIKKVSGEPHQSWRATAPDQRQFTAETLQDRTNRCLRRLAWRPPGVRPLPAPDRPQDLAPSGAASPASPRLNTPVSGLWSCRRRVEEHAAPLAPTRRTIATTAVPDREEAAVDNIVGIILGFALTTIAGGWWAARLQDRSWARQNELRLREAERERAAGACRELTSLLDRRLYRMLRLLSATRTGPDNVLDAEELERQRADYDEVLYAWNDRLNTSLSVVGSHFGDQARADLEGLYEDFKRVGQQVETALRAARSGADASHIANKAAVEFEGRAPGSLNDRVYQFGLMLNTLLREGQVGRDARTSPNPAQEVDERPTS